MVSIDSQKFQIKGITFDFRNKYKYAEDTEALKKTLQILIPFIEEYLKNKKILPELSEKLDKARYQIVHFAITDPHSDEKGIHFGSVSFDPRKRDLLIVLRMLNGKSLNVRFELMKTLIHEIFHFFIRGEENVVKSTDELMTSRGSVAD